MYRNFHKNYQQYYNATLVVPVYSVDDSFVPVGALSIDNQAGGLDKLTLQNYAREVAWRIAVLHHRIRRLEQLE